MTNTPEHNNLGTLTRLFGMMPVTEDLIRAFMQKHVDTINEFDRRLAQCSTDVFSEQPGAHDGERVLALVSKVVRHCGKDAGKPLAAHPHSLVPEHVIVTAGGMPVLVVITESGTETEVLCDRLRELFALTGPWSLSNTADARENEIMEDDK